MSMMYLKDRTAIRFRETAERQHRSVSATLEIMLDFEDQRFFVEQEAKKKLKQSEVKK